MTGQFTAKYVKIDNGYYGQIIEWPEVITEGASLEECRLMLIDALTEMIKAYQQQNMEIPGKNAIFERIPIEISDVSKKKRTAKVS